MRVVVESRTVAECSGWDGETLFKLDNGQIWEQAEYRYRYFYKYRPKIRVWTDGGRYQLEVEGVKETIRVQRVR